MAKGKKTGGRDFKKGEGGRKPLPEDIKAARNMSYEDMCRTVIEVRNLTTEKLKEEEIDKIPLGKRAIINAYAKLEYKGIKDYEDRLWGKAKETIDLESNIEGDIKTDIVFKFDKKEVDEYIQLLIKNGIIESNAEND